MKRRFKIYLSLICIILFFPVKSLASTTQCNLFVDSLLSSPTDHKWEKIVGETYLNNFGFLLQYDWDDKNKKTFYRKDDNGNYIVGKIHN